MKKIIILPFLIIASYVYSQFDYLPTGTTGQIIKHTYYTLSYSEHHEQSYWIAYQVTKENLQGEKVKRKNNFRIDKLVETGSASLADYKKTGYDRGHLASAADMSFNSGAMSESFYMSNMSPQKPQFNRGIWKKLETLVRKWAVEHEKIYVVTAPILDKTDFQTIGENNVSIPEYYYKVILDSKFTKMIALVLPNEGSKKELSSFVVTVDELESLTGIDFFPNLNDDIENKLEGEINLSEWFN